MKIENKNWFFSIFGAKVFKCKEKEEVQLIFA